MNRIRRSSILENRNRTCTDWPCLVIFIVLLILYFIFALFVFRNGSLNRFIYPTDSQGRICGVNSQINRNYLQFFDIIKCIKYILIGARCSTSQICVEQCPTKFYHYKLLYAQELKLSIKTKENIQQIRTQLSCQQSAQSQINNINISIYSLVKERKICAPYAFPSMSFYGRCIPSVIVHTLNFTIKQANDIIKDHGGYTKDDDIIPSKDLIENSFEYMKKTLQIKRILSYMFDDLIQSRYIIFISYLFALIILGIYMFLLRYIARWMIWISLILCIIVFALATTFAFTAWFRLEKSSNNDKQLSSNLQEMNIIFDVHNYINIITDFDSKLNKSSTLENFQTAMMLLEDFAPMRIIWLIFGILCCIICIILMICVACLYDRISLAATLIEEASKAICHALATLICPIITFILSIIFVIFGILVLVHYSTLGQPIYQISCGQDFGQSCQIESSRTFLLSNGSITMENFRSLPISCLDYNEGDQCNPEEFSQLNCTIDRIQCIYISYGFINQTFDKNISTNRLTQYINKHSWFINIFNIFIIYWLLAFIIALEEMILANTFACYYWQLQDMKVDCCAKYFEKCFCLEGIHRTFRYHLGTIAFGSSIIAIIDTIRTLIDLLKDRLEMIDINSYGKCFVTFIKAILRCLRCCFEFFSRYTYIMTAISGKWFCSSAFTATRLLLKNCLRAFVLDRVCAILLYIGRITITIGSCALTAYLLNRIEPDIHLHFSWFPVLIIGLSIYISSSIFLNVYSTATSTLFFCILYDLEYNNDLQIKSLFMSNDLKKIFNQSNDFRKNKIDVFNESNTSEANQSRF